MNWDRALTRGRFVEPQFAVPVRTAVLRGEDARRAFATVTVADRIAWEGLSLHRAFEAEHVHHDVFNTQLPGAFV